VCVFLHWNTEIIRLLSLIASPLMSFIVHTKTGSRLGGNFEIRAIESGTKSEATFFRQALQAFIESLFLRTNRL